MRGRATKQATVGFAPAQTAMLQTSGVLRRKCSSCDQRSHAGTSCQECMNKRQLSQRLTASQMEPSTLSSVVDDILHSSGSPLDPSTRAFMEPRFVHDFSRVPVGAQSKLTVSQPDDHYEQEADQIAEQVTSASQHSETPSMTKDVYQRRQPPAVGEESAGFDFSRVRVHADMQAAEAAEAVNARAFTLGNHIVFGAGKYAPHTVTGRRLLAHELAHVGQQGHASSGALVQRSIRVEAPAAATPNPPAGRAKMTNAAIVESWIDQLCPTGNWTVDAATGIVSSPDRNDFCAARPARGHAHSSTSGTPTSCRCLCELTASGSIDVRVHAANAFTVGGNIIDVTAAGEGVQLPPAGAVTAQHVGVSGKEFVGIEGTGDTSPHSGAGQTQVLRDPPWIIFGHEVCGHARLQDPPAARLSHLQTPRGNEQAVDVENLIRREHSTVANSFGIRKGNFTAGGAFHFGSIYQVQAGETLVSIARRCGLTQAEMLTRIFRENGDPITVATQNKIRANERLLIDGVFWHEVIAGEAMSSIATMWNIPLASLTRANPQIADPRVIRRGQRLLVPAS